MDVSKNRCALVPSAYTEIDGVYVATVPLMVAFKICAIARQNRSMSSDKLVKDALDLMSAVKHLKDHNETIPQDIVQLLDSEKPRWDFFWAAMEIAALTLNLNIAELEQTLRDLGVTKVRNTLVLLVDRPTSNHIE